MRAVHHPAIAIRLVNKKKGCENLSRASAERVGDVGIESRERRETGRGGFESVSEVQPVTHSRQAQRGRGHSHWSGIETTSRHECRIR